MPVLSAPSTSMAGSHVRPKANLSIRSAYELAYIRVDDASVKSTHRHASTDANARGLTLSLRLPAS